MPKLYACNKYRYLRIKHLKFENGLLRVDNKFDRELVESNDLYGAHIFPVPEPEVVPQEVHHGQSQIGETDKTEPPQAAGTPPGRWPKAGKVSGHGSGKKVAHS